MRGSYQFCPTPPHRSACHILCQAPINNYPASIAIAPTNLHFHTLHMSVHILRLRVQSATIEFRSGSQLYIAQGSMIRFHGVGVADVLTLTPHTRNLHRMIRTDRRLEMLSLTSRMRVKNKHQDSRLQSRNRRRSRALGLAWRR